jgi:hypothetical protein
MFNDVTIVSMVKCGVLAWPFDDSLTVHTIYIYIYIYINIIRINNCIYKHECYIIVYT